ncbi:hypothetical protein [Ligilactobacillus salivarius]|uniref:Uncharacterized protein n=1 Tax=Ligilactobacillus salivarius TaxID=1624 RepID=A0A1Y0F6Q4_9LACO|nr:hypothetical protein [Ligilactobacillus salivarius]ARU18904.1 hypothetical protein B7R82_02365 [Ligilactobacillus salivarius]
MVEHQLTISVAGKPRSKGVVSFKQLTIRERILRYLLGSKSQIMVIASGQSVKQIRIKEANTHEQD